MRVVDGQDQRVGNVIASTGPSPSRLIWDGIRAREPRRQRFAVGSWQVTSRPTVLGGLSYWIAIGSLRESVIDDLGEPILDSVQRLLGVIRSERAMQHAHTRTEAQELLTALRGVLEPADLPRLWDRLGNFRFRAQMPVRAFVSVELPPSTPTEPTTAAAAANGTSTTLLRRPSRRSSGRLPPSRTGRP